MHDPFQSYPTVGSYAGMTTPSNLPYTALQASLMNPAAAYNPFTTTIGQPGIGSGTGMGPVGQSFGMLPYNIAAQQLQAAAILAAQTGNPQLLGLAGLHNPLQAALLTNPLIAASLLNPYINGGYHNPLLGTGLQSPFQTGLYGNPLLGAVAANPFLGGFQNPALNPYAGQNPYQMGQFGLQQQYSPYSQLGHLGSQLGQHGHIGALLGQIGQLGQGAYGQIGYPLAPQSWVGQAGPLLGGGQYVHPLLQQIGMRTFQNPGIGSWI